MKLENERLQLLARKYQLIQQIIQKSKTLDELKGHKAEAQEVQQQTDAAKKQRAATEQNLHEHANKVQELPKV